MLVMFGTGNKVIYREQNRRRTVAFFFYNVNVNSVYLHTSKLTNHESMVAFISNLIDSTTKKCNNSINHVVNVVSITVFCFVHLFLHF